MKTRLWRGVITVLALACFGLAGGGSLPALSQPQPETQSTPQSATPRQAPNHSLPQGYQLPPSVRAKAIAYSRTRNLLYFGGVAVSLLIYFFLWRSGIAAALRNRALRVSPRHFLQCLLFAPAFFVAVQVLEFPFDFYSDYLTERRFGLLNQCLASWMADRGKDLALLIIAGTFLVWLFYFVVRRSPRRWWLYFWALTVPVALFVLFIEPFVVEPLFFQFTPLAATRPALVNRIEDMLHHAGLAIPPSHILEMNANSKTTTINAYVSGLGASKRVVVWDNTLDKLNEDQTLLVLGHETGHYVLHHVVKEFILIELVVLGLIAIGFVAVRKWIARLGARSRLEGEGDLASLPLMLLVLTGLSFFSSPIVNGISRHYEHQADQFALEVTYGVVPHPNVAEASAFQILGEHDLADPDPNPLIVFWLYSHPPVDERIRFALSYKPWTEGRPLQLIHRHER